MTKNHTKTLAFTTLDISQRQKHDNWNNIYSVNLLYLLIDHANGYIKQKNGNKYWIFDSVNENKELLKKYNNV